MVTMRPYRRCLAMLILTLLALGQSGCLWIAAGAASGAAVGYIYTQGSLSQVYGAAFDDTWNATRAALADLGMKIKEEEHADGKGFLKSETANGETVRIHFEAQSSKFPSDGALTHVSVRIGVLGDEPASTRILHQVETHLTPMALPGMPTMAPPISSSGTPPTTTAPPPLATPLPPVAAQPVSRTATGQR